MPVILGMLSIFLGQFVVLLPDMLTKMSVYGRVRGLSQMLTLLVKP